ncbi:MAG: hypothetical protein L3V56_01090 [Candidatus Magnetoovum sp. WYHC-5]|nr:hypothetical protein [Candidatus Magnetoovum sp. WYHC-5]
MLKDDSVKDEKIVFFTSKTQLDSIDDYRFSNRISSRAEAVRQLIDVALSAIEKKKSRRRIYNENNGVLIAAEKQEVYKKSKKTIVNAKKK